MELTEYMVPEIVKDEIRKHEFKIRKFAFMYKDLEQEQISNNKKGRKPKKD